MTNTTERKTIARDTSVHDAAIEILRATNDGDDLNSGNLKLLERAVNGHLNWRGVSDFYRLLDIVRKHEANKKREKKL